MKIYKKTIIIGAFLLLLTISYFFLQGKKNDVVTPPQRSFDVQPAPDIPFVPGAPQKVRFFPSEGASFPLLENMTTFSVIPFDSESAVRSFSSKLDLPEPTTVVTKQINKNIFWDSENISLSYLLKPTISTLSFQHKTGGFPTAKQNENDAALFFLHLLIEPDKEISIEKVSYEPSAGEAGNNNAIEPRFVSNYEYTIRGAPILMANFSPSSAHVSVDDNNAVVSATFIFPPKATTQRSVNPTISIEGIVSNLNADKGLLISAFDSKDDVYGAPPEFSSVEILSASPAYYYDETKLLLRPSYLIDGLGIKEGKQQFVQYFLFATEN